MTQELVNGAVFLFNHGLSKAMMQRVSESHLFRPLVHSWPLRTVIKVEQYVLTAVRLHRGATEGKRAQREQRSEREGSESVSGSYDKNCLQSLQAQAVKARHGKRRHSRRTKQTRGRRELGRAKGEGGD